MLCQSTQDSLINVKSRGGQKDCEESEVVNDFQETAFSRYNGTDTHTKSKTVTASTRLSQVPSQQNLRMGRGPGKDFTPIARDYQHLFSAAGEKACFLQRTVVHMYRNHIPGWPPAKKELVLTSWSAQLVTSCCFHIEKETEREKKSLDGQRYREIGQKLGMRMNMINIYCIEFSKGK